MNRCNILVNTIAKKTCRSYSSIRTFLSAIYNKRLSRSTVFVPWYMYKFSSSISWINGINLYQKHATLYRNVDPVFWCICIWYHVIQATSNWTLHCPNDIFNNKFLIWVESCVDKYLSSADDMKERSWFCIKFFRSVFVFLFHLRTKFFCASAEPFRERKQILLIKQDNSKKFSSKTHILYFLSQTSKTSYMEETSFSHETDFLFDDWWISTVWVSSHFGLKKLIHFLTVDKITESFFVIVKKTLH